MDDVRKVVAVDGVGVEEPEVAGHAEQPQANDQQPGDRAAAERHLQRLVEADARRLRGAHVGAHRDVHADDAAGARKQRAEEKAERRRPAERGREANQQEQHRADDRDGGVLAAQVGDRALADRGRDLAHALVAVGQPQDAAALPDAVDDGNERADERENEAAGHNSVSLKGDGFYQVWRAGA